MSMLEVEQCNDKEFACLHLQSGLLDGLVNSAILSSPIEHF